MDLQTQCYFSIPQKFDGSAPTSSEQVFQFSQMNCTTTNPIIEQVSTTDGVFYINQSSSYGEILILIFIFLFLVFGIVKFFTDFFIPKRLDWKRQ